MPWLEIGALIVLGAVAAAHLREYIRRRRLTPEERAREKAERDDSMDVW